MTTRRWQFSILGLALCLLAALFAFEAKIAWYVPGDSSGSQVSALKLQQTDAPRHMADAVASSHTLASFPGFLGSLATILAIPILLSTRPIAETAPIRHTISGFLPQVHFRPPPAR